MGPIRYEWFEEIRSENGNAFVLDLTNTGTWGHLNGE